MTGNPLHPNAALRVLRREMVRLNDSRLELIEAMNDPRIPSGLAEGQAMQCDAEMKEIACACRLLEDAYAEYMARDTAPRFAAE